MGDSCVQIRQVGGTEKRGLDNQVAPTEGVPDWLMLVQNLRIIV